MGCPELSHFWGVPVYRWLRNTDPDNFACMDIRAAVFSRSLLLSRGCVTRLIKIIPRQYHVTVTIRSTVTN